MNRCWLARAPRFETKAAVEVKSSDHRPRRVLEVDNLSVSGLFARTVWPLPAGTAVEIDLVIGGHVVRGHASVVRVVHKVADPTGDARRGMGLQLEALGHQARRSLVDAIMGLVERALQQGAAASDSGWPQIQRRINTPGTARCRSFMCAEGARVLASRREHLQLAWQGGLERGEIFVTAATPPGLGARLDVSISGPNCSVQLRGRVVDVIDAREAALTGHPPGVSLQLSNLRGRRRRDLLCYLQGRNHEVGVLRADPGALAVAVRSFLRQLDHAGADAAIGVDARGEAARQARVALLKDMFSVRGPGVPEPLIDQLDSALWELQSIEDGASA